LSVEMVQAREQTLAELAETANREHAAAEQAAHAWLDHAIAAGEALIEAKRQVVHGNWTEWLRVHADCSQSMALQYIRVATYKGRALDAPRGSRHAVMEHLRGLPGTKRQLRSPARTEEAQRLIDSGLTQKEAAEAFGVSESTMSNWVNPDKYRKKLDNWKTKERRRSEAERALREKEERNRRDAAAKRAGGAVSHAYSNLRKTAADLQAAIEESDDRGQEATLRSVLDHVYKAEDELVRALGVV
jgi:transposase